MVHSYHQITSTRLYTTAWFSLEIIRNMLYIQYAHVLCLIHTVHTYVLYFMHAVHMYSTVCTVFYMLIIYFCRRGSLSTSLQECSTRRKMFFNMRECGIKTSTSQPCVGTETRYCKLYCEHHFLGTGWGKTLATLKKW